MELVKNFKKQDSISKLTIYIIIFAILLRFIIAAYTIEGGDPCYHSSAARFIGRNFRFPLFEHLGREIFAHEPLFHIIGGFFYAVFNIFGNGDLGVHMVSPIFGSASIIVTFLIARKLFDKHIALFAVIFTSFLPLHIYHSTTAHIDMVGAFFALLSVYFLMNGKFYFSSISFGLSLLGRINSLFIAPLLAYLLFKKYRKNNLNKFLAKIFLFFVLGFLVVSPWYARNQILLHNPIWPFLNSFFNGYYQSSHDFKPDKIAYMLNVEDAYVEVHLALFGIPDGKYENLFLFKNPLFSFGILVWVIFTLASLLPFLFIFKKKYFKDKNFQLLLWGTMPYLFFLYFYQFNYGNTSTRYMLTAIPFLGVIWAYGIKRIMQYSAQYSGAIKKIIVLFLILFILGFSASEAIKTGVITFQWKRLDKDFEWVRSNTEENDLFLVPGQCLGYRLDRPSFPSKGTNYGLKPSLEPSIGQIDYIFDINNIVQGHIKKDVLSHYMPYFQKVYENNKTNVKIYKRK